MQVIIFKNENDLVSVVYPADVTDLDVLAAAIVPKGSPWRIIDHEELPPADEWLWSAEGPIVAAPPAPPPVPEQISFAQAVIGMVAVGWITEQEGRDWRDRVSLPNSIKAVINQLPAEHRFAAETRALAPSVIERTNQLLGAFAASQEKTTEDVDAFFRYCATI